MASLEKHKRNLVSEFLEGVEAPDAAQSRGVHLVGAAAKGVARRFRPIVSNGEAKKPDPALIREPALPPKPSEKASQASSPEHLRKVARLPQLRAPYVKPGHRPG